MLSALLFVTAGFLVGGVLTALVAIYVIGLIHAEAVQLCDSYGGALFGTIRLKHDIKMEAAQ